MLRHNIVTQGEASNGNTMWGTLLQQKVRHTIVTHGEAHYGYTRWDTL